MQDKEKIEVSRELLWCAEALYRRYKESLPKYANKYSPKKFTCAQIRTLIQLQALFVMERHLTAGHSLEMSEQELGRFLHNCGLTGPTSFRAIADLVRRSAELRLALELKQSPNYSTLFRAAARLQADRQ